MISVGLWEAKRFQQCPDGKTSWCVVASHFHMAGEILCEKQLCWDWVLEILAHVLHYQRMGSAAWVKSTTLASPSNAVARLVIAYKGKLVSKASCCWNTRTMVGHCCCGVGREVWRLVILLWQWWMSLMNIRVAPPTLRWRQRACLTRSVTARFLARRTLTHCDTGNSEIGFAVSACLFYYLREL